MRYLLALCLLLPVSAVAADLRITWSAVLNYEDDQDETTLDTLPGPVVYEVWGGTNGVLPRLLTTTPNTETLRLNVGAQVHCYYVVTVHQNPDGTVERSAPSLTSCKDMRPVAPPVPTPRTSGVPEAPSAPVIEQQ
jgi:hypothetical protein